MLPDFFQPTLAGPTLDLRPLREDDLEPLYAVASDPKLWEQHPSPLRYERPRFEKFFAKALAARGTLTAIHRASGAVIGSSRYYDWDASAQEIVIGYTFVARDYWGGPTNAELKRLMLNHAFEHARAVWFHVAGMNLRSQRAMAKIGATLHHRGFKASDNGPQEYLFYRILPTDPWRFGGAQNGNLR